MGRIDFIIPDELEKQLRIKAVKEFGGRKGSLTKAVEASIKFWIENPEKIKELKTRGEKDGK